MEIPSGKSMWKTTSEVLQSPWTIILILRRREKKGRRRGREKREVRRNTLSSDESEWPDSLRSCAGIILHYSHSFLTKTRKSVPVGPGSPSYREPSMTPKSRMVLLNVLRVPLILVSLSLRIMFTQTLLFWDRTSLCGCGPYNPQPPEFWDYRCALPCLASLTCFFPPPSSSCKARVWLGFVCCLSLCGDNIRNMAGKCKIVALGVSAWQGGGGLRIMLPSLSRRALSTLHHYDKDLR